MNFNDENTNALNEKAEYYRHKIMKYKQKIEELEQNNQTGGQVFTGKRLYAFANTDFPNVNERKETKFWSSGEIAERIGTKGYYVEFGTDVAKVVHTIGQGIARSTSDSNFGIAMSLIKSTVTPYLLSNTYDKIDQSIRTNRSVLPNDLKLSAVLASSNHSTLFEELRRLIPRANLNRYVIVSFGLTSNTMDFLSNVSPNVPVAQAVVQSAVQSVVQPVLNPASPSLKPAAQPVVPPVVRSAVQPVSPLTTSSPSSPSSPSNPTRPVSPVQPAQTGVKRVF